MCVKNVLHTRHGFVRGVLSQTCCLERMVGLLVFTLLNIATTSSFELADANNSSSRSFYDYVNSELSNLASEVIRNYMTDGISCVNVISENYLLALVDDEDLFSIIRMSYSPTESGECDPDLLSKLFISFSEYCPNYVVQISQPQCFLIMWENANYEYPELKHNPRILILPVVPDTVGYTEDLYALQQADLSTDILTAEYSPPNDTDDWFIHLYTNNFAELPTNRKREGSILLDKWKPGSGFENGADLYQIKTLDLEGKEVKVFVIDYSPYTYNDPLDGVEVRIIRAFCEFSNCTFVNLNDHREWGAIDHDNRSGYGCAGLVYTGESDFCIGANYAWILYWPYVDFSLGYSQGELTIIVPKPTLIGGWATPFLPFPLSLWFAIIGCILISTVGLYLTTIGTWNYAPRFRQLLEANSKFLTMTDSFVRSIGMLVLQQPQQLVPGSPSRYLFTAMEIVYLVVTTGYAAELYDYLTIPRTTKPIENKRDMADSNTIWLGNDYAYTFLIRHTDDPYLLKLVNNFKVYPIEEIITRAERGGYGVVTERLEGGHFVELAYITEKIIDLSIAMKESYVSSPIFAYLRKGSPYTERINQIIGRMMNAGLYPKWEDDSATNLLDYSKQQKLFASTKKVTYPPKVLTVGDLEGAFMLYTAGIFISMIFFVRELHHARKMKSMNILTSSSKKDSQNVIK